MDEVRGLAIVELQMLQKPANQPALKQGNRTAGIPLPAAATNLCPQIQRFRRRRTRGQPPVSRATHLGNGDPAIAVHHVFGELVAIERAARPDTLPLPTAANWPIQA